MDAEPLTIALRFAAALGLGVMLGLERERQKDPESGFAGVRTIGLIALMGGIAAYVESALEEPWLAVASFVAIGALVTVSYVASATRGALGITTEISTLLAFLLGYLCLRGQVVLAAGLAVASGGILALKQWLHGLAGRIETADVEATLKFAIVSLIVLPLVPNENYGPPPLDVINPYKIWLMVVLISGLNFASYVLVKVLGAEHGIGVTGILGGLVSSTAVTLGFAERSREKGALAPHLALGILLAWLVMFARVVVMVGVVAPPLVPRLALSIGATALPCFLFALWLRRRTEGDGKANVAAGQNPFELGQAIRFGVAFGVISFAAKAAEVYFGEAGLYLAGALAGLTDVDAISLSMANLAQGDPSSGAVAARTIVIAILSNTAVKGGMAMFLGSAELRRAMAPAVAATLAVGAAAAALLL
ncbi:MAG TPA: MgtC/SapB family protein [Myxococcota bacterium]|nr:MgtC/SapB family protein [Myxococcota bacterium]